MEQAQIWRNSAKLGIENAESQETLVHWMKLQAPYIKVNVNRAAKGNLSAAGASCVLSDHQGRWLIGSAQNLGVCSSVAYKIAGHMDGPPISSELWL